MQSSPSTSEITSMILSLYGRGNRGTKMLRKWPEVTQLARGQQEDKLTYHDSIPSRTWEVTEMKEHGV